LNFSDLITGVPFESFKTITDKKSPSLQCSKNWILEFLTSVHCKSRDEDPCYANCHNEATLQNAESNTYTSVLAVLKLRAFLTESYSVT